MVSPISLRYSGVGIGSIGGDPPYPVQWWTIRDGDVDEAISIVCNRNQIIEYKNDNIHIILTIFLILR